MRVIDYQNPPCSDKRPRYGYQAREMGSPLVSIITPFQSETSFDELLRCVQEMSLVQWEWILVDAPEDIVARLQQLEPRVKNTRSNGQGIVWQRGAASSHGRYILQLDGATLVEPTFVEKCVWFLETHANFAFCNSYWIAYGAQEYAVSEGFERGRELLEENRVPATAVVRREAYDQLRVGEILQGAEDWYLWLAFAEAGLWGYTLPQHLIWVRQSNDLSLDQQSTRQWIAQRFSSLAEEFPSPQRIGSTVMNTRYTRNYDVVPFTNPLTHNQPRILLFLPTLATGGVQKVLLDWSHRLIEQGWGVSIVSLEDLPHTWESEFLERTPDIFHLPQIADYADYGRFLRYVIDSRQIEVIVFAISEAQLHYVPYLRAFYPDLVFMSFIGGFFDQFRHGYGLGASVSLQSMLNLSRVASQHLKATMVHYQADPEKIAVVPGGIDPSVWNPEHYDRSTLRARFAIDPDIPLVLFVGRISEEKRPTLVIEIIHRLEQRGLHFLCALIGEGPELPSVQHRIEALNVERVQLVGAQTRDQVREWLAMADCLLLPSGPEGEGLPNILVEAMAMEVVPIASAADGPAEILTPEVGFTVPFGAGEADKYADLLQQLFEDEAQRRAMGKRGRALVQEQFTLEKMETALSVALEKARSVKVTTQFTPAVASYLQLEFSDLQYYTTDLESAVEWFKGQMQNWEAAALQDKQYIAELIEQLEQLRRYNDELTEAKTWLEGQVQNWQTATQDGTQQLEQLRRYNDELTEAKTWLEGQVKNWQTATQDGTQQLEQLRQHNDQLNEAKTWLEGQVQNWQTAAEEGVQQLVQLRQHNDQLNEAKAWLEGQVQNWQTAAEQKSSVIDEQLKVQERLQKDLADQQRETAELREILSSPSSVLKYYYRLLTQKK